MSSEATKTSTPRRNSHVELIIGASNVLLMVLGIFSSVVISRSLGPEERGLFVTWQTWSLVLGTLGVLGAPQSLVLPTSHATIPRPSQIIRFLGSTVIGTSILVATVVSFLGGGWLAILAGVLSVASTQMGSLLPSLAQREGRLAIAFNAYRLTPQFVGVISAVLCALLLEKSGALWLIVISLSQFIAVISMFILEMLKDRVHAATTDRLWAEAWRIAPASWSSLLQYRVDILVVAAVLPARQVAFYAIGVAVQNAVFAVGQSTGMKVFSERARGLRGPTKRLLLHSGLRQLMLALVCSTGAWLLVPAVYGQDYAQARVVAALLAFSGAAQSLDYILWHIFIGSIRSRVLVLVRVPSIAFLVLFVIFSSGFSEAALIAAVGALISNWLAVLLMILVAFLRRRIPPSV